jgi:hypothetical protein
MDYSKKDYNDAIEMNDVAQSALILPAESFDSLGKCFKEVLTLLFKSSFY